MSELLPCPNPWCPSHDDDFPLMAIGTCEAPIPHGRVGFKMHCIKCGMRGPVADTKAEAIAAWNTRAALSRPADHAGLVEALGRAKNDLLEVGNDYPGSSCQKWCTERAAAAWNVLTPWKHCPSTHCERAQECRSVNECSAEKSTLNRVNSAALADLIADTADHPEPETDNAQG